MCVLIVCMSHFPDTRTLELCEQQNPQGWGVAWRNKKKDAVNYVKGIESVPELEKLIDKLPTPADDFPIILHARVASSGSNDLRLNHPFTIGTETNELKGSSKKGVLFHNGTLFDWRREMKAAIELSGRKVPDGRFTDTRAMAFIADIRGINYLDLLNERIIVLTPKDLYSFGHTLRHDKTGWYEKDGLWFSNSLWENPRDNIHQTHLTNREPTGIGSLANIRQVVDDHWKSTTTAAAAVDKVEQARKLLDNQLERDKATASNFPPTKEPVQCGHDEGTHWIGNQRFCKPCGIRMRIDKDEPMPFDSAVTAGYQNIADAFKDAEADGKVVAVNPQQPTGEKQQLLLSEMTADERIAYNEAAMKNRITRLLGTTAATTMH